MTSSYRVWTKHMDQRVGGRAVLTWVQCGGNRLLAVVDGDPPVILVPGSGHERLRMINGRAVRVVDHTDGSPWFAEDETKWGVGCRTHGHHIVLAPLVASAFNHGRRRIDVATVADSTDPH